MAASHPLRLTLLLLAAALLVAHSLVFNFVTDDAYISFVYARNLAAHGQLVFNLGEPPVEGYTNFLWTLLLAGFLKLGLLPELMARLLGTLFAVATFAVLAAASRRLQEGLASLWDALPALLLAGVSGYACWASGGLETQLFTFLITLGACRYLDETLGGRAIGAGTALSFGLAALTRPEGLLFFGLTLLHHQLVGLWRQRKVTPLVDLQAVAWFALLVVPHLLWRRSYYGWWLPNTFYIKASGIGGRWEQGGYYLLRVVVDFHLWIAPLLVALGHGRRRERGATLLLGYTALVTVLFALYVASVGGDFMGLYRFVMPVVPLVALVVATSLRLFLSPLGRAWVAAPLVALLLLLHGAHAAVVDRRALVVPGPSDRGIDRPGWLRWYTNDRAAIGRWFARYARPDDYAAVGGAGAQVYYSGLRSLDCYGLSDEYIAHKLPAISSRPGHQKYATDEYILSRQPTIITSHNYMIAHQPHVGADADFWRARGYRYVSVPVEGLSSPIYSFLLRSDRSLGPLPASAP